MCPRWHACTQRIGTSCRLLGQLGQVGLCRPLHRRFPPDHAAALLAEEPLGEARVGDTAGGARVEAGVLGLGRLQTAHAQGPGQPVGRDRSTATAPLKTSQATNDSPCRSRTAPTPNGVTVWLCLIMRRWAVPSASVTSPLVHGDDAAPVHVPHGPEGLPPLRPLVEVPQQVELALALGLVVQPFPAPCGLWAEAVHSPENSSRSRLAPIASLGSTCLHEFRPGVRRARGPPAHAPTRSCCVVGGQPEPVPDEDRPARRAATAARRGRERRHAGRLDVPVEGGW